MKIKSIIIINSLFFSALQGMNLYSKTELDNIKTNLKRMISITFSTLEKSKEKKINHIIFDFQNLDTVIKKKHQQKYNKLSNNPTKHLCIMKKSRELLQNALINKFQALGTDKTDKSKSFILYEDNNGDTENDIKKGKIAILCKITPNTKKRPHSITTYFSAKSADYNLLKNQNTDRQNTYRQSTYKCFAIILAISKKTFDSNLDYVRQEITTHAPQNNIILIIDETITNKERELLKPFTALEKKIIFIKKFLYTLFINPCKWLFDIFFKKN